MKFLNYILILILLCQIVDGHQNNFTMRSCSNAVQNIGGIEKLKKGEEVAEEPVLVFNSTTRDSTLDGLNKQAILMGTLKFGPDGLEEGVHSSVFFVHGKNLEILGEQKERGNMILNPKKLWSIIKKEIDADVFGTTWIEDTKYIIVEKEILDIGRKQVFRMPIRLSVDDDKTVIKYVFGKSNANYVVCDVRITLVREKDIPAQENKELKINKGSIHKPKTPFKKPTKAKPTTKKRKKKIPIIQLGSGNEASGSDGEFTKSSQNNSSFGIFESDDDDWQSMDNYLSNKSKPKFSFEESEPEDEDPKSMDIKPIATPTPTLRKKTMIKPKARKRKMSLQPQDEDVPKKETKYLDIKGGKIKDVSELLQFGKCLKRMIDAGLTKNKIQKSMMKHGFSKGYVGNIMKLFGQIDLSGLTFESPRVQVAVENKVTLRHFAIHVLKVPDGLAYIYNVLRPVVDLNDISRLFVD